MIERVMFFESYFAKDDKFFKQINLFIKNQKINLKIKYLKKSTYFFCHSDDLDQLMTR
jgi:hypothetical protein